MEYIDNRKIILFFLIAGFIGTCIITYQLTVNKQNIEIVHKTYNFYKELDNFSTIYTNIKQEIESKTNNHSLQREIEKAKEKLSHEDYKAAKSTYNEMVNHCKKLDEYKQNPEKYDNKNILKNAATNEIRQQIINGRIKHLEKEITKFYNNIIKILQKAQ